MLGEIRDGDMLLSEYGKIAESELKGLTHHYSDVEIALYAVMPNHIHMIVHIIPTGRTAKQPDIPNIIGKYKAGVTRAIRSSFPCSVRRLIWQTSYHDHIIRNEKDYLKICEYVQNNPKQWELDCHNPISPKYKDW